MPRTTTSHRASRHRQGAGGQPSVGERARYAFDNFMARGTIALVVGLFVVSALIVVLFAAVVTALGLSGEQNIGWWSALWRNLLRTLDPGTMGADEGSTAFLAMMLAVTLGGIFVIAALIGVISSGLDAKLVDLRKGRSRVIERDHTVILGWSPQIFTVLAELEAGASGSPDVVVVLADRDTAEMQDEIRVRLGSTGNIRVVCRRGRPTDLDEIDIANVQTSKAIIVLSPGVQDPDTDVLKTMLAIVNDPNRRPEPYHVVAMLQNMGSAGVARIVGGQEVQLVVVDDVIARITAQACRQSGLSVVYTELLDYSGDAISFARDPALVGTTFGAALHAYGDSTLIGIHNGRSVLNPPMTTPIGERDQLILIKNAAATMRDSWEEPPGREELLRTTCPAPAQPERVLVLGWNRRAQAMITELDKYVGAGSELVIVDDEDCDVPVLANLSVKCLTGHTTDRAFLDGLEVGSFDHVVLLCGTEGDPQTADARTLVKLLHLRDIASRTGSSFSITSEMIDPRNRVLAEVAQADDFIVSDRLASLMITQIAKNKHLSAVFADLFDAAGSEIYLKPVNDYVQLGEPVDFHTVIEAARRRQEVAIGYRVHALRRAADKAYGVVINPRKDTRLTYADHDCVIVLAED